MIKVYLFAAPLSVMDTGAVVFLIYWLRCVAFLLMAGCIFA